MKLHRIFPRTILVLTGLIFFLPLTGLAGWQDLTAQQLKSILDSDREVVLLNPLSDLEFNEGHIPGSINIPLHTIMRSKAFPENRDTLIVTYCLSKK